VDHEIDRVETAFACGESGEKYSKVVRRGVIHVLSTRALQSAENQSHYQYSIRCGQNVGIKQVSDHIWLITFDAATCKLEPLENPFAPKVTDVSGINPNLCAPNGRSKWLARREGFEPLTVRFEV